MKAYTQQDRLGRELTVDDCVAYDSHSGGLTIGQIIKINRVCVRIQRLDNTTLAERPEDIWPRNIIKLDSRDVELYLLKQK